MKVNINHEELNKKYFHEISAGGVFVYQRDVFMKLDTLYIDDEEDADCVNAILLETGDAEYFCGHEEIIIPKMVEMNVEY